MIRCIAAIDSRRGIATDKGIPWDLPGDRAYYREKIANAAVIMGYSTYIELSKPLSNGPNFVVTHRSELAKPGFRFVNNPLALLQEAGRDMWILGGSKLFASTIEMAEELYLTRIEGNFHCSKFFPSFEHDFELISRSEPQRENDTTYYFEVWKTA